MAKLNTELKIKGDTTTGVNIKWKVHSRKLNAAINATIKRVIPSCFLRRAGSSWIVQGEGANVYIDRFIYEVKNLSDGFEFARNKRADNILDSEIIG